MTASKKFTRAAINLFDYPKATKVNASAVTQSVEIIGNGLANSIQGGKGDDTLTGGAGKDVFIYSSSTGNDVITDYTAGEDKIKINGSIKKTSYSGNDVIFTIGTGTLRIIDGKGKKITINNTTKSYGSSISSLFEENNFVTADNLSEITKNNLMPTALEKISAQNFENLTNENNFITYSEK